MKQVFTNATIFTGKEILTGSAILVDDGIITGFVYDTDIPDEYEVKDLGGNNIAPAMIDLQIYGGNGYLFSADPSIEAIEATYKYCLQGGASKFLLTAATNTPEVFNKAIAAGATVTTQIKDFEYGYRQGNFTDPFGQHWTIEKSHLKLLSIKKGNAKHIAFNI